MTRRTPAGGGSGPGRPRIGGPGPDGLAPRDEILDAAAYLFVSQGVARTSTREIAEAIGIRQASLYYHFAGKDEIVSVLLDRSIRPTLDKIEKVEQLGSPHGEASAAARLYVLLVLDVRTLIKAPRNAGMLARLPEVQSLECFAAHRAGRDELVAAYGRLGELAQTAEHAPETTPPATGRGCLNLGAMLLQLAEVVIRMRSGGRELSPNVAHQIATSGLRMCGIPADRVQETAAEGRSLIGAFDEL